MKHFLTQNILYTLLMLGTSPLVYAAETTDVRSLRELAIATLSRNPAFLQKKVSEAMHLSPADRKDLDALRTSWCLDNSPSSSVSLPGLTSKFLSAKFNIDNTIQAFASYDGCLCTWNLNTGTELPEITKPRTMQSAILSPNSRYAAIVLSDGIVEIWSLTTNKRVHIFDNHYNWHGILAFNHSSTQLVSISDNIKAHIWSSSTRRSAPLEKAPTRITALAFNSNGRMLARGLATGYIQLSDPTLKTSPVRTFGNRSQSIETLTFNPHSTLLASASYNHLIKLWEVATGQCLRTFGMLNNQYNSLTFSHDSTMLISSSQELLPTPRGSVQIWDTNTSSCLRSFDNVGSKATSVTLNRDSSLLTVIQGDKILHRKPIVLPAQLAALTPEERQALFDTLFTGERNEYWPALAAKIPSLQFIVQ